MQEVNYYNHSGVSQSMLKVFINSKDEYHYKFIVNRYKEGEDTDSLGFGRYYHTFILEPENLSTKYIVSDFSLPEGKMATIIQRIVNTKNRGEKITKDILEKFKLELELSYSVDTIIKKIKEEIKLKKYFEFLSNSSNKEIVCLDDYLLAHNMSEVLLKVSDYFKSIDHHNHDYADFRELDIFWTYSEIECKSKIDWLRIDFNRKKIYIKDLKTTSDSNTSQFIRSIKYYGYDIQASFYIHAVIWWFKKRYNISDEMFILDKWEVEFSLIPQKTSAPFQVLDEIVLLPESLQSAEVLWQTKIRELASCILFQDWQGEIKKITIDKF